MLNQQQSDQTPLTNMQNIGATIADRLKNANIFTLADLRRVGPAEAYQRLRLNDPTATLPVCYYLYSLYAALEGKDWRQLTASEKRKLREEAGIG
jgi:hypothetical protein